MKALLEHLALLPGMPSIAVLRAMAETEDGFPAEQLPRLPGRYAGDPLAIVSFVLDRWPTDAALRPFAAAMRVGTLSHLRAIPGLPSLVTIRSLIDQRPDFPLIERGSERKPYRVDIPVAAAFILSIWSDGRRTPRPATPRVHPGE